MSKIVIEINTVTNKLQSSLGKTKLGSTTTENTVRSMATGFLPPMVRWVDPTQRFWLLELPPSQIAVSYYSVKTMENDDYCGYDYIDDDDDDESAESQKWDEVSSAVVPIPWQVWLFNLRDLRHPKLWFRTTSLRSLEDEVYHCFLPNVYSWDVPCFYGYKKDLEEIQDIPERLKAVLQEFWFGTFDGSAYMDRSEVPAGEPPGYPPELMKIWKKAPGYKKLWIGDTEHNLNCVWPRLENLSVEDILKWTYIPAGTLNTYIDQSLKQISIHDILQRMGLKS